MHLGLLCVRMNVIRLGGCHWSEPWASVWRIPEFTATIHTTIRIWLACRGHRVAVKHSNHPSWTPLRENERNKTRRVSLERTVGICAANPKIHRHDQHYYPNLAGLPRPQRSSKTFKSSILDSSA